MVKKQDKMPAQDMPNQNMPSGSGMDMMGMMDKIMAEVSKLKDMKDATEQEVVKNITSIIDEMKKMSKMDDTAQEESADLKDNKEVTENGSSTIQTKENIEEIELAKWTTAFINGLPNSSFVIIEPAYLDGKTENKNARHLPYKDANGNIDLPHLRNAMARANQIQAVTDSITTEELRRQAMHKLESLAKNHLPSDKPKMDAQPADNTPAPAQMSAELKQEQTIAVELSKEVAEKLTVAAMELSKMEKELSMKEEVIGIYKKKMSDSESKIVELEKTITKYNEEKAIELKKRFSDKANKLIELYSKLGIKKDVKEIELNFSEEQIDRLLVDLGMVQTVKTVTPKRETKITAGLELDNKKDEKMSSKELAETLFFTE